ncbi:hypothetical protein LRAMOSA02261 [Lichtheimia ramosa]|uniref:Methyltransferase domain-containing protein n=1 Tax=Lichtheimia ramosa TaxID=688394 RepID=A0A077WMD8_9FUNG|nr:hypothetical protein LRAMOSA02261 [Lichtheimia ramosa]
MGNRISKKRRLPTISSTSSDNNDGTLSLHSGSRSSEMRVPITEAEVERQHYLHFLLKHIFQTNYFAPIEPLVAKQQQYKDGCMMALDISSGYCPTWTMEMAQLFPQVQFHGVDANESIPLYESKHVPANVHFVKGNILDHLDYPDNTFLYAHQRMMYFCYYGDDIPHVLSELKRVVKPDGWVELMETDVIPKRAGPMFKQLLEIASYYLKARQQLYHGPALERVLKENGFQDVTGDYRSIPVCWGGYVGKIMYENVLTALRTIGPIIYQEVLDTDGEYVQEEFDEYIDKAFDECVTYQTFFNIHWAYGRKPSTTTPTTTTTFR